MSWSGYLSWDWLGAVYLSNQFGFVGDELFVEFCVRWFGPKDDCGCIESTLI